MPKKRTLENLVADAHKRLKGAAHLARVTPTGSCDPACCDTVVAALDVQRQDLIDALAQNLAAEVACVECCRPQPPDPAAGA